MTAAGVRDFLWHGGRSSVLARGSSGADRPSGGGWLVGSATHWGASGGWRKSGWRIEPWLPAARACSSSGYQGKRYGHILDPRTGWPAEGVFSTTVVAPTAAEADALSTAFYVLGIESAPGNTVIAARRSAALLVFRAVPAAKY